MPAEAVAAPANTPKRAVGMAVPLVQVLWLTSGLWAFTSKAVPVNTSDSNINRNVVFILLLLRGISVVLSCCSCV